jgi:hypothetical protein
VRLSRMASSSPTVVLPQPIMPMRMIFFISHTP